MRQFFAALLAVILMAAGRSWADELVAGRLSGQFMISSDIPLSEGLVYVYNLSTGPAPSRDRFWRVPDFSKQLDNKGRFNIKLPPGEFYVGAIKRSTLTKIGPPAEGDYFVISLDENNKPLKYLVTKDEKRDIGIIAGALPFKQLPLQKGMTAIEGIVQDPDENPVAGAIVFAFMTPTITGKPLFVSDRSNNEGKFVLRVHEGGSYYLKVRDDFGGGPPRSGSLFDGDKDETMQNVLLKTGQIAGGIKLQGKTFPGRGRNKE